MMFTRVNIHLNHRSRSHSTPFMAAVRASARSSVLKSPDGKMAAMPFLSLFSSTETSFLSLFVDLFCSLSIFCMCCTPPLCVCASGSACGWQGTSSRSCHSTASYHPICWVKWQMEGYFCPSVLVWYAGWSWAWT